LKDEGIYKRCDNVVEGVCAGDDTEASDCEKDGKIDTGQGTEDKLRDVEGGGLSEAAVEEDDMVVCTEQGGGDEDGDDDGVFVAEAEQVLQQHHQQADEDESEEQFLVDTCTDARDDICQEGIVFYRPNCLRLPGRRGDAGGGTDGPAGVNTGGILVQRLWVVRQLRRAVEEHTQDKQGRGKHRALDGHWSQIRQFAVPAFSGGQLQGQEDDDDRDGGCCPGEPGRESEVFEEVLQPDEGDDANLGVVEDVGVYQQRAKLIDENKGGEEDDGVDGSAGAFEVGVPGEVEQLRGRMLAFAGHFTGNCFPGTFCQRGDQCEKTLT